MIVGRKERSNKRGELYVQTTKRKIRIGFDAVFVTLEDFDKYRNDEKSIIGVTAQEGRVVYSREV